MVRDGTQHNCADCQRCQRRQQAKSEAQAADELAQADEDGQALRHRHRQRVEPVRRAAEPVTTEPAEQLLSAVAHEQ